MKLYKKAQKCNPLGGIHFVAHKLKQIGIKDLIASHFESRVKQAKYGYEDVILGTILLALCGGEYIEDVALFKDIIEDCRWISIPSPDTIGRMLKSLAVKSKEYMTKTSNKPYQININHRMLDLNFNLLNHMGKIKKKGNILDIDVSIISNYKYDRQPTYNKQLGYAPMFGFINQDFGVYCGARSGNTGPMAHHLQAVKDTIDRMNDIQCSVDTFRADAASYNFELVNYLEENEVEFFIRAKKNRSVIDELNYDREWTAVELRDRTVEVSETWYKPSGMKKKYRMVVTRVINKRKNIVPNPGPFPYLKKDDPYVYRGVLTSNTDLSMEEVILFYDGRGRVERNFELLKQFNIRRLPFSFLNENAVYMIITMMSLNIFRFLTKEFSQKVDFVQESMFLRSFINHFMVVVSYWGEGEKRQSLYLESNRRYEVLLE